MRQMVVLVCVSAGLWAGGGAPAMAVGAESKGVAAETGERRLSATERVVVWYGEHLNYGTIALLMAVESSFIPFPSEVVVPPAAYKASQKDSGMNLVLVVVFATLGALAGAMVNYLLAMWLGRPLIYRLAESRLGRLCLLSADKVAKAERYFVRHGKLSTFIGRLVPAVRQLISLPAGLSRMPLGVFTLYTALGAMLWNIVLAFVGYVAGGEAERIAAYSAELSYALLAMAVVFVLYLLYNGFVKKRRAAR